jgi:polyisoprenoid-binding protein YceI
MRSTIVGLMAVMLVTAVGCNRVNEPALRWVRARDVSSSIPPAGAYVIDPDHSFVHFAAQHMVIGTVRGRFNRVTGAAMVGSDPRSSTVTVLIESASLDTQHDGRDAELRGPDFFDVAAFPTMEYHGAGLRHVGYGWIVDGSLTIRGVTRKVPLELVVDGTTPPKSSEPRRIAIHATGWVKRKDFGMIRGLLDEIGTVSARPDVLIEIDAEFLADPQHPLSPKSTRQSN